MSFRRRIGGIDFRARGFEFGKRAWASCATGAAGTTQVSADGPEALGLSIRRPAQLSTTTRTWRRHRRRGELLRLDLTACRKHAAWRNPERIYGAESRRCAAGVKYPPARNPGRALNGSARGISDAIATRALSTGTETQPRNRVAPDPAAAKRRQAPARRIPSRLPRSPTPEVRIQHGC